MKCPCCGHVYERKSSRDVKQSLIDIVRQYQPITAPEIAALLYDNPDELYRRRVIVHISQINARRRVITTEFRGQKTDGYRYVGPE